MGTNTVNNMFQQKNVFGQNSLFQNNNNTLNIFGNSGMNNNNDYSFSAVSPNFNGLGNNNFFALSNERKPQINPFN